MAALNGVIVPDVSKLIEQKKILTKIFSASCCFALKTFFRQVSFEGERLSKEFPTIFSRRWL